MGVMAITEASPTNDETQGRDEKSRNHVLTCLLFLSLVAVLLIGADIALRPAWFEWNNYSTTRGFYEQPNNTIEALFVGNSNGVCAFSPIAMYDEQGICAYNLSTEQQSAFMSYYWIKEANRLHGDSLRTVVLEVNELRRSPDYAYTQKALIPMRLSEVKLEAAREESEMDGNHSCLENLFPLLSFHSRWSSLDWSDWAKFGADPESYKRGYRFSTKRVSEAMETDELNVPLQVVTSTKMSNGLTEDSLLYLDRIADFCKSNDLQLILVKTPTTISWGSSLHNEVQAYADEHDIAFLDMTIDPLITEIGYEPPIDTHDTMHLNYFGALKVSSWIATYLHDQCGCEDKRNVERYSFLEEDSKAWHNKYDGLIRATGFDEDISEYLRDVCKPGYAVTIICQDDASKSLSEEQRLVFRQLGLSELALLDFRDSYIAVVKDGEVVIEERKGSPLNSTESADSVESSYLSEPTDSADSSESDSKDREDVLGPLSVDYLLPDNRIIHLKSGGHDDGNIASFKLDKTEYTLNQRGINVVVYDHVSHAVIDSTCFDTFQSDRRISPNTYEALDSALDQGVRYDELPTNLQAIYRYRLRYNWQFDIKHSHIEDDKTPLATHLNMLLSKPGLEIAIVSSGNMAPKLGEEERTMLKDLGLVKLAKLKKRQPYCCLIESEGSINELTSDTEETAHLENDLCRITSNGNSASDSHIWLVTSGFPPYSDRYSPGLFVVAYDPVSLSVVDSRWF